jgi:hypothetical protein
MQQNGTSTASILKTITTKISLNNVFAYTTLMNTAHITQQHSSLAAMEISDCKRQQKILKRIELKCLEMKEMMLAQSHPTEYIELRISRFRQMLLKKENLADHGMMLSSYSKDLLLLPAVAGNLPNNCQSEKMKAETSGTTMKKGKHDRSSKENIVAEMSSSQMKRSLSRSLQDHSVASKSSHSDEKVGATANGSSEHTKQGQKSHKAKAKKVTKEEKEVRKCKVKVVWSGSQHFTICRTITIDKEAPQEHNITGSFIEVSKIGEV